jgi:putative DNA primase/helicase
MIDLRTIAAALGGEVCGQQVLAPGPGHSPRDRSLSVTLSPTGDGFLCYSHAGDDWQVCRDHVRTRLGLPRWRPGDEQDRRIEPPSRVKTFDRATVDRGADYRPRSEDDLVRIAMAKRLWDDAQEPRGTPAERYLNSRALELTAELAGPVLRFHPRCPWRNENTGKTERIPALIAAFRSIDDDKSTAIHRIALNPDGSKIGRRMLGVVHRAAVKLDRSSTGELAIAEGIETAMAARQLGIRRCWALGSVGAISFFPIIPNVATLRIAGENDAASQYAIEMCGQRWRRSGRRVRVIRPTAGDKDLNDALMRNGYGRAS